MKKIFILIILLVMFIPNTFSYSKAVVDITDMDIYQLQDAIDKGYLTYELLTTLYLERIEEYNDTYNAILNINPNAIEYAKALDLEHKTLKNHSLLYGMPIVIKDNIDVMLLPTTVGTKALKNSYPKEDADVIKNLVINKMIILGKTNMSEFAFSAKDSFSSYGHVYNSYDPLYTPMGSSGGSAVSVSANLSLLALGTDTNSSIRLPASANNLVGLRPTYNLISLNGIVAYDKERDVVGPITKTVSDNAILMTALNGNTIDYTDSLKLDGLNGKNIGIITYFYKNKSSSLDVISSYDPDIASLMELSITKMEEKGANIILIDDFYSSYYDRINRETLMGSLLCYDFNQYIKNTSSSIKSFDDLLNSKGYVQGLSTYNVSCNTDLRLSLLSDINIMKEDYRSYVKEIFEEYEIDVMVYPTMKSKVMKISNLNTANYVNISRLISPTTGYPAITIPMGFIDNLPYGIEFLALDNEEQLLYEVGYSFEQINGKRINPDIAPSLYETSSNLKFLIDYYESDYRDKALYKSASYEPYEQAYLAIKDYLLNYNNENTDIEEELITNYVSASENLILNYRFDWNQIYLYPFYVGVSTYLLAKLFFYTKRKKKKS